MEKKLSLRKMQREDEIDLSNFRVKPIIAAEETKVIYEIPNSNLNIAWEKQSNLKESIQKEIYFNLRNSLVENEIFLKAIELTQNNVLGRVTLDKPKEKKSFNLKSIIQSEVIRILDHNLSILNKSMKKEDQIREDLEIIDREKEIVNGQIKIHLKNKDNLCVIYGDKNVKRPDKILSCSIRYKNLKFNGFLKLDDSFSLYEALEEFLKWNYCEQSCSFGHFYIKITVEDNKNTTKNCVYCASFLKKVVEGCDMKKCAILFTSQLILNVIEPDLKIVNNDEKVEIDELTTAFYGIQNDKVYKIYRTETDFYIFLNGKYLDIIKL
ncbi:hypothetical protein NUSPORA_00349 [Nucleospora cyclopteri]